MAFQNLLNEYCKPREFYLIPELDYKTRTGKLVYPDGTVKDALRLDWGYWESKDQFDNLDEEINKKLKKGYPDSNILFEDSQTAVLIQSSNEILRVPMQDGKALDKIITTFINYVRPEVKDFRTAIGAFKQDLPKILDALRDTIDRQNETNTAFRECRNNFWEICKKSINPEVTLLDVREMMIQHILTEDIFINIFNQYSGQFLALGSRQKSYRTDRVLMRTNKHEFDSCMEIIQSLLEKVGIFANRKSKF